MSTPGEFFGEHRKAIDARKAHLARVGIHAPDVAPLRDEMPSQADILVSPVPVSLPMSGPAGALQPSVPDVQIGLGQGHGNAAPPKEYDTPKLPRLPGVNAKAEE